MRDIKAMMGYANTTKSGADDSLKRDQMLKIGTIVNQQTKKYIVFDEKTDYCGGNEHPFVDISKSDWSYIYACYGKNKIVTGYESGPNKGKLLPANTLVRPEFLAIAFRILNDEMPSNFESSYSDVMVGQWYAGFAKYAYENGIFPGKKLYLDKTVTRREVARAFFHLNELKKLASK